MWIVERVPTGFVPDEDKGLLIAEVRLPVSASQNRTLDVIKRVESAFLACDGVNACASFQGFSLIAGNGSNYGVVFAGLKPQVTDVMHATGLYAEIGGEAIFATEQDALRALLGDTYAVERRLAIGT